MKRLIVLLGGLMLVPSVPSRAQEQAVSFSIGDRHFSMPVPEGYCLPEGPLVEVAGVVAEADRVNFTKAVLFGCTDVEIAVPVERYFLVKTSRSTVNLSLDKAPSLATWEEVFRQFNAEDRAKIAEESDAGIERALGEPVKVSTTSSLLGRDDECVYTGGNYSAATSDEAVTGQVVTCLTVRGQRAISIHFYDLRPGEHIESLKSAARSVAISISTDR